MDPNLLHPETLAQNPKEKILPANEPPNEIEEAKKISKRALFILSLVLLILVPSSIFLYSKYKPQTYKSVSVPTIVPTVTPTPDTSPIPSASPSGEQVACAQDAKLCPDGSYVSREGPNCEFAACPN